VRPSLLSSHRVRVRGWTISPGTDTARATFFQDDFVCMEKTRDLDQELPPAPSDARDHRRLGDVMCHRHADAAKQLDPLGDLSDLFRIPGGLASNDAPQVRIAAFKSLGSEWDNLLTRCTPGQLQRIVEPEPDTPSLCAVTDVDTAERRPLGVQTQASTVRGLLQIQIANSCGHIAGIEEYGTIDMPEERPS
jgi:hypothetical protein